MSKQAVSNLKPQKKKREFPSALVIVFIFLLIGVVLTYIVPAGTYERVYDEATNRMIVDPGTFQYVERNPVGLFAMFQSISQGMQDASWVVFMIVLVSGALEVINSTGALSTFLANVAEKYKTKGIIMVPVTLLAFSILGCVMSLQEIYIAFAGLIIIFSRALGFDALTGVIMLALGQMIGFISGEFNAFSVGTSQGIIGLPMFSGVEYRLVIHVIYGAIAVFFTYRYARMIQKDPQKSYCYDAEQAVSRDHSIAFESGKLDTRQIAVLLIMLTGVAFIGYASFTNMNVQTGIPATFIIMAFLTAFIYRYSPNEFTNHFVKGAQDVMVAALLIGLSRSVSVCLESGLVLDSIVHAASEVLMGVPKALSAIAMFIFTALLNFLIGSGSGKAVITMPVLSPIGDIIGMRQQLIVLAYQFGDGVTNLVSPGIPLVMVPLAIGGVSFKAWMKFIWKPVLGFIIAAIILLTIFTTIGVGPF